MALPGEPILPPPDPPDFIVCDRVYGLHLRTLDCLLAANNSIAVGAIPVEWQINPSPYNYQYRVPVQLSIGTCIVAVEMVLRPPQNGAPITMLIAPNDIRSLAAKVVQQCVTLQGGIGGFGTLGITSLAAFVSTGATPWNTRSFPISTRFLTVSVRNTYTRSRQPGRSDPAIALALAQSAPSSVASIPGERLLSASQIWSMQAEGMQRGSIRYWYSNVALAADMTYQCDANLGAPSVVDCTQIEWSQLNPSFSTLAVSPGITTFLHSNTCYLAISAVVSLVITWAQIRTAVSTLINMCIETPYQNTRGGRAYYTASQVIGNPGRRMRRDSDLTGLNALPPGMNVTMFEQKEPWTNPAAELYTCTWEAVSRGSAVSACPSS